jgi:hypothetical protein
LASTLDELMAEQAAAGGQQHQQRRKKNAMGSSVKRLKPRTAIL